MSEGLGVPRRLLPARKLDALDRGAAGVGDIPPLQPLSEGVHPAVTEVQQAEVRLLGLGVRSPSAQADAVDPAVALGVHPRGPHDALGARLDVRLQAGVQLADEVRREQRSWSTLGLDLRLRFRARVGLRVRARVRAKVRVRSTLLSVPKPSRWMACSLRGGRGGSKTGHVSALSTPSGSEQIATSACEIGEIV